MLSADLPESEFFRVAAKRCSSAVERQIGVRTLELVPAVVLERGDHRRRAAHKTLIEGAGNFVIVLEEAMAEIEGADVGARRQIGRGPVIHVAVDGSEHGADAAAAAAEVLG